jgi:hypothetical protein
MYIENGVLCIFVFNNRKLGTIIQCRFVYDVFHHCDKTTGIKTGDFQMYNNEKNLLQFKKKTLTSQKKKSTIEPEVVYTLFLMIMTSLCGYANNSSSLTLQLF